MTLVEEAVISGFIGEVISKCTDISWDKIKKVVTNRNNKHQNIESQIYNVIVNVLNLITSYKYKNDQDKVYQSAEKLFAGYKNTKSNSIEVVKHGLQVLGEYIDDNRYMVFKILLYQELCKNDYEELYRQLRLFQQDEESDKTSRIEKKVDNLENGIRAANKKLDNFKREYTNISAVYEFGKKFQNNKKEKYIKNWNSRLFLHLDNEERPLNLKDAYIMPDCGYRMTLGRIKYSEKDNLESLIHKFVIYEKNSNMLISGVPGIGKSTITSWIANQYKNDDSCIILRFRDWESEELKNGLLKSICDTLECKKADLENKLLILDGFDEMKTLDIRMKILNTFLSDIKDFENFKCIITSRPAYIDSSCFYNRIELLPFGIDKIEKFYQKITGTKLRGVISNQKNLDVLGVPVILYMAIMSNIDITQETSKPELYSRIFAKEGGIFDRFCEYDNGSQILRNPENVKKHLDFLKEVAFIMFEKNNLQISKDSCKIPELESHGKPVSILEFPIKHLFENTNPNIEFIHGSIYEYFVAEYIITSIIEFAGTETNKFAEILGKLLKSNKLTKEIIEFLKYKIINRKLENKFSFVNDTFNLMLKDGMTYYTQENYKKVHLCEKNIFVNMLEIIHLWTRFPIKVDPQISDYLKYNENNLNLEGMDLRKVDLTGVYLQYANMQRVDLSRENFSDNGTESEEDDFIDSTINGADLRGADLRGADLRGRDIEQVDFKSINIREVIFDENQIRLLSGKKYELINTKVYVKDTKEIITYQEYKKRSKLKGKKDKNLFITMGEDENKTN